MNNFSVVGNPYEGDSDLSRMGTGHRHQGTNPKGDADDYEDMQNKIGNIQGGLFIAALLFFASIVFPPVALVALPVIILVIIAKISEGIDKRKARKYNEYLQSEAQRQYENMLENQFQQEAVQYPLHNKSSVPPQFGGIF